MTEDDENKEKSMHRKYKDGEIRCIDYENELMKTKGFNNLNEFRLHLAKENGFDSYGDYIAHKKGFSSGKEYRDNFAKSKGFKDWNDYLRNRKYASGETIPHDKNKSCSMFLGVHIAERVLSKVFENVERMPINNSGYDFICKKGFKIEVKSACLTKRYHEETATLWKFLTNNNKIADYFLLIAFDNREDLSPLHIWLIKGNEKIGVLEKRVLNEKITFIINNTPQSIKAYETYELNDKLDKVKECCDTLKEK